MSKEALQMQGVCLQVKSFLKLCAQRDGPQFDPWRSPLDVWSSFSYVLLEQLQVQLQGLVQASTPEACWCWGRGMVADLLSGGCCQAGCGAVEGC